MGSDLGAEGIIDMPKAKSLKEAYNNLVVEPLETEEEFRDFYVERPEKAPSPIEELKHRIEISDRSEKYLFLGFRGSGKSTELNRLLDMIDPDRFLVVSYSIRDQLNVSDFDFRDFFVSMALMIYERALAEGVDLNEDIEEDFNDFIKRVTNVSVEEVIRSRAVAVGLPPSLSEFILLKLGREAKTREYVRKELEMQISDLIQRLNWLIVDVEDKTDKKLVVIVDDLDKLTRIEQAEEFFYKNYELLTQPSCFVIYTFPIPLTFNPYFENVRPAFDDAIILPQLPVINRDGSRNETNLGFYRSVVRNRMEDHLIDDAVLDEAILSTGKLSEFVSIMRDATIKAYRNKRERIAKEDVESALEKLRRTYDRTLTEAHKRRAMEIHESKEARDLNKDDGISRELLFSLTAVEYEDENGRWCDVDPLLLPLVEKWKMRD
jgi:hypothetical protein